MASRFAIAVMSLLVSVLGLRAQFRLPSTGPRADAAQFQVFPVVAGKGEFIGLSLINTAIATNDVTVTWTDADGNKAGTGSLSLAPGFQSAALVREILGIPEDPKDGWIRIDSSQPGLVSYMSSGGEGILDGTEPAAVASTRIIIPYVAVETGFMELAYTDTLASLVNPGDTPTNAHVELVGLDSLVLGELNLRIPARASRTLRLSDAFNDVLLPNQVGGLTFRGYLRVSSDGGLAGWSRIDTPLTRRLLRARGTEEIVAVHNLMASHFVSGSPFLYRSEINCVNAGNASATLEVTAQDNRGARIGQAVRRTLNPGQGFRQDLVDLLQVAVPAVFPPPMTEGYIRIRAADGGTFQTVCDISITGGNNTASMVYPMEDASSAETILPFVVNDSDYFTGYAISNPNELLTVQTDVTVTLLDRNGRLIGPPSLISLSPSSRFVSLVDDKVSYGYLRIRANGPFSVTGSIGTRDGATLVQLPAVR